MSQTIDLIAQSSQDGVVLLSPGVGIFTGAAAKGFALVPQQIAGYLTTLGRTSALIVPAGVSGVIRSSPPERVHEPVGWGSVLYELAPLGAANESVKSTAATPAADGGALVMRSPQTGRFYHRPAPADAPLVEVGKLVMSGVPIGLIEVMKTFTHVVYQPDGGLPERARVVRVLVRDGGDVNEGDALIEVESA